MRFIHTLLIGLLASLIVAPGVSADEAILGYIAEPLPESPQHAKERHRRVAERRQGHPIIFHRGAVRQVTENTLECYSAAIDMGADGVEIDIHRTKDGVLILHHDDHLGRTFEGQAKLKDKTYYELLQAKLKNRKGPVSESTRIPTLAAFLELARQRAMLIHLDVKQSGIQDDIIAMIDKADMWDHLVEVNGGNADKIRPDHWNEGKPGVHNKVKLIPYAQEVPLWPGEDEEVRKALLEYMKKRDAKGTTYMFFGGREHQERLARILGNKPTDKPTPIPETVRAWWSPQGMLANHNAQAAHNKAPRVFILNGQPLLAARRAVIAGEPSLQPAFTQLLKDADEALKMKPVSVTDKKATPPSGDKHDYMSLGSYWWPNPKTKDGLPYVRRDGEGNPEAAKLDSRPLHNMVNAVNTLATAYFFSNDARYADKAAELIRVWFLNPKTKMNPHLNYGQSIPGICDGRGIGIIDTACLVGFVDSVGLLHSSAAWTEKDHKALQQWFAAYLKWLTESPIGLDEAKQPNNHGTYYDAQVASFALFVGQDALARKTLKDSAKRRIASQIEPDGSQPWELRRTKAWGYSMMNLRGMMYLAWLGECVDVDLWQYKTEDGRSIRKALDFLVAYAQGNKAFEYKQIKPMRYEALGRLLRQASIAYDEPKYEAMIAKLPDTDLSADRMQLLWPKHKITDKER